MPTQKQQGVGGLAYDSGFEREVNSRFDNYYKNIKQAMQGSEEEKDNILRRRILKFFQDYRIDTNLFYIEKRQLPPHNFNPNLIQPTSLLLHGIDFLSLDRLRQYFSPFQVQLSIFDDSHCAVNFHSYKELVQCLFTKIINRPGRVQQLFDFFQQNSQEKIVWREIEGYRELMFERKLFARFLTRLDDSDQRNGDYGRKMMSFFQKTKVNFLRQMENKTKPKKNIRDNFRRNYGKKWRSETNSSCSDCQEKLTRMREDFLCEHHRNNRQNNKCFGKYREIKEVEGDDERGCTHQVLYRRSRSKGKRQWKYSKEQMQRLQVGEFKVQPFIQKITGQPQDNSSRRPPSHIGSSKKVNFDDSGFYDEMMAEFQKYKPFDNISEIDHAQSMSQPQGVSFFERDEADDF